MLLSTFVLGVRLWIGLAYWSSLDADPDAYRSLAVGLAEHQSLSRVDPETQQSIPTAYRPPLYPFVLSFLVQKPSGSLSLMGVVVLHVLLGWLTACATAWTAMRVWQRIAVSDSESVLEVDRIGAWAGAAAALLVAGDPILLRQATLIMTETLATALAVLVFWLATFIDCSDASNKTRSWKQLGFALLLGAILGIAILCRPTSAAWLVLILLGIVGWRLRGSFARSFVEAGWILVGALVFVGPWVIRNQIAFHKPLLTNHSGYTLYLANNPVLYRHLNKSWSRSWDEDGFHRLWKDQLEQHPDLSEVERSAYATELAISTMREQPTVFMKSCLVRMAWFWALWPDQRQAGVWTQRGIGIWYGVLYVLAIAGGIVFSVRGWYSKELAMMHIASLGLLAHLCLAHAVYWSNMRMRAPLIPLLAVLASLAIAAMFQKWLHRSRGSRTPAV